MNQVQPYSPLVSVQSQFVFTAEAAADCRFAETLQLEEDRNRAEVPGSPSEDGCSCPAAVVVVVSSIPYRDNAVNESHTSTGASRPTDVSVLGSGAVNLSFVCSCICRGPG